MIDHKGRHGISLGQDKGDTGKRYKKLRTHEGLSDDVAKFLADGGEIERVGVGVSATPNSLPKKLYKKEG